MSDEERIEKLKKLCEIAGDSAQYISLGILRDIAFNFKPKSIVALSEQWDADTLAECSILDLYCTEEELAQKLRIGEDDF